MGRRRFDHLVVEVSVAVGFAVPRYALWLELQERGIDPEALAREDVARACDTVLPAFLRHRGVILAGRAARRLRATLLRFDPRHPTPDERLLPLS